MKSLFRLPSEYNLPTAVRPYINHSVEFKKKFTRRQRLKILQRVGFNVFAFPSEMVTGCDLLSDSGTTTMTNEQWAMLHLGDEAYGSNRGYFKLLQSIADVFGEDFVHVFLFHQGRAAEQALFKALGGTSKNLIIPSNGHFDTTKANIEDSGIAAVNLFSPELKENNPSYPFKGNMDKGKLVELLKSKKVPLVYLTVTNNTGGGQPVSMENIREVASLAHKANIPVFLDACRFAENAFFIKSREKGYKNKLIENIVKEMFSYVDGFTISFKKDGLVNMGGGLILKRGGFFLKNFPYLPDAITNHQILTEGHPTYGGMSGRDIMTLVFGLKLVLNEDYLSYRINQVKKFGESMLTNGLPVVTPFGGHAVYLDMNKFFEGTKIKAEDFGGIAFTALLLAGYGHRACELGNFAFGSYNPKSKKSTFPEVNFVRFAVPRLRYEHADLENVAEAAFVLYKLKDEFPKVKVIYGKELVLRHFKAKFSLSS